MPQLKIAAIYHFLSLRFLRCEYHANVINIFDIISKIDVFKSIVIFERQEAVKAWNMYLFFDREFKSF